MMFFIQYTNAGEGSFWARHWDRSEEPMEFDNVLDGLEARDLLRSEITNAQKCNYHPQYRVVDEAGKVYEYEPTEIDIRWI